MKRYKIETERGDLFDVNMMITISVLVKGEVTCEQIENAFKEATQAHEILNTKVVIDKAGQVFYKEYASGKNGLYYTNQSIEELIKEQEKKRFHLEEGEFLRLFVDNTSLNECRFHFMMHHLGGDGKSLCYFIESFLRCLNGEEIEKRKLINLTQDMLPKESALPFFVKSYVKRFNKAWKKVEKIFGYDDMDKSYASFWKKNQTEIELSMVEENELKNKLEKCHAKKIGYTSYYIAEQIKDCKEAQDVGLAVDGRLDQNRCMGNQATGISVKYKYNPKKSVWENASKIDSMMKEKLKNQKLKYFILHFMASFTPTLVDAVNLEHAKAFHSKTSEKLAKVLGYGEVTKDLSITNLTVLDIPVDYGQYHIEEVWFIPPVVSYGKNMVGMVTVNNRLFISKHYYDTKVKSS